MRIVVMMLGMLVAACGSSNSAGDAGTDADSDSDGDTDSETGTDSDTLLPTPECAEDGECASPLICNELWGLCVVADCADQDDFVPCEAVTDPDRAYDICIRGVCRSPGCGTVDCNPPGPHFTLGDSNQRVCFGGGVFGGEDLLDECPAPGSDFYGQDAQFGWDTLHDPSERFTRSVPVPEEPIVEDHATGLVWQGCSNWTSGEDCGIPVEPEQTQWKQLLAYCDSLAWGGFHDWRLPDRWETESLLQEVQFTPKCDEEAFPDCSGSTVWTISKSASDFWENGSAFVSRFERGDISDDDIYHHHPARCVRGLPNPRPQFRWERDTSVTHQPVVHDHWTGLTWQGCPKGQYDDECESGVLETASWKGAFETCAFLSELSWGGRDDWRVPSRHELSTIVDDRFVDPALDPEAFATTYYDSLYGGTTWTSTSVVGLYEDEAPEAQSMSMYYGALVDGGHMPKFTTTVEVRCVAGGQE